MSARISLVALPAIVLAAVACTGNERTSEYSVSGAGAGVGTPSSSNTSAGGAGGGGEGGGTIAGGNAGYTIEPEVSWHQPALATSIHFAPEDDLETHVLARLGEAQTSIRLAFFNIRLEEVKNLLVQKKAAGVDVHVILDKKQQDLSYNTMGAELVQAGIPMTLVDNTSSEFATMHDKFAVVDGHLLMTGSANYSFTALNVSDEDLLTTDDASLAARYQLEFDELLADGNTPSAAYPPNTPIQAFMGPEDGLSGRVVTALNAAQSSAVLAMFEVNTSAIVNALISAQGRGVNVVVVLDQIQADDVDADADESLAAAGIPVIKAHNTGGMQAEMHSKFVVIDHQRVLMGSYNWTNMGSFYNDENMIVIDDAHLAARVEGKFADLVDSYPGPSPTALGLVEGVQPVTFQVGNVTLGAGVELTIQSVNGGPFATPVTLTNNALSTTIAAGTRVTYRYAIVQQGSTLIEEAGTHSFTVPYAAGPFQVSDAFVP
jgi:phosphatidylserine/phosphatidylglycerophosphate/cardiolipin synthase-like enzyme